MRGNVRSGLDAAQEDDACRIYIGPEQPIRCDIDELAALPCISRQRGGCREAVRSAQRALACLMMHHKDLSTSFRNVDMVAMREQQCPADAPPGALAAGPRTEQLDGVAGGL